MRWLGLFFFAMPVSRFWFLFGWVWLIEKNSPLPESKGPLPILGNLPPRLGTNVLDQPWQKHDGHTCPAESVALVGGGILLDCKAQLSFGICKVILLDDEPQGSTKVVCWVGLTRGLVWLVWVGFGSEIFVFIVLGWVMGLNVYRVSTGEFVLQVGALFLRQTNSCLIYRGSVEYMGWVGYWVHTFTWQWVGLGQVSYLVGWVWLGREKETLDICGLYISNGESLTRDLLITSPAPFTTTLWSHAEFHCDIGY